MKVAEKVEMNGAAISEECLQFAELEQCQRWREVEARWARRWNEWKACP